MTIGAILRGRTGSVISAQPDDTVRAVADLLAQNRIGAVPVVDGDAVVGIFPNVTSSALSLPMAPKHSTGESTM